MELFDEVKNRYFLLMMRLINESRQGANKSALCQLIHQGEFEQKVIGKNQQSFEEMVLGSGKTGDSLKLLVEKDGKFYPSVDCQGQLPVPIRFTKLEKAWLRAMLEMPDIQMVLSEDLVERFKKAFEADDENEWPLQPAYQEMTNQTWLPNLAPELQQAYEENFKILLQALTEGKPIRYHNCDRHGNVYADQLALPLNLEYSLQDGRFRISMYSVGDQRAILANIFSLSQVEIVDDLIEMDRDCAKRQFLSQKYCEEPIVLQVTDQRKAMERCFMSFAGMERTARDLGNHLYEIRLKYYDFEEENVIRNILSLGPYVKVLSPHSIVKKVVHRIDLAIDMQEK